MKLKTIEHEEEYFYISKRSLKKFLLLIISFFMCYPLIRFIHDAIEILKPNISTLIYLIVVVFLLASFPFWVLLKYIIKDME